MASFFFWGISDHPEKEKKGSDPEKKEKKKRKEKEKDGTLSFLLMQYKYALLD